jgi:putative ABC transport system permease protein
MAHVLVSQSTRRQYHMLKNYLKVALRSLIKQRIYSIINILGLAIGIASALLITLYVQYEFSYDKFFENSERIFKVSLERKYPNHSTYYAIIPHSYSDVIARDIPEVKQVVKVSGLANNVVVNYKDQLGQEKTFEEDFVVSADSNFFTFFHLPFVKGDPATALRNPNDLVLTETTAKRYFGNEDPIGKTLDYFGNTFKVTGVCQDIPANSHLRFNFINNITGIPFFKQENYTGFSAHVYVELNPDADYLAVESKIPKLVDTYAAAQIERNLGKSWEDYKKEGNGYRYFLQPLTSIHLDPTNIEAKMEPGGSKSFMYFLITVAVLLVVIACINFMNLATARSAERAREVGVRKTMGSLKGQLVGQFLSESILISLIATGLSVVIIQLLLPAFGQLTEKPLALHFNFFILLSLLTLALFIGFIAGSYPAFVLSGFNPVVVMKGNFTSTSKGTWLRNSLVIFQFTISIILIVGTLVVQQQMKFIQTKSLGFDKEQMLVVERVFALPPQKARTFVDEVRRFPEVSAASGSLALPGREGDFFGAFFQPEGSSEILTTKTMVVADDLIETLGIQLVEGKLFAEETNDSLNVLLNESAVKTMGLKNPVGLKLANVQRQQDGSNRTVFFTVIGIVKDFHFQSLRDQITPLVLQNNESAGRNMTYLMARVKPGQYESAISSLESKWKELAPEQPFKYLFLDENFNAQYKAEQQAGKLFAMFAGLAILVACVGLFGLSAYTAHLRTREIGIRKVMGASVDSVVILLAKDFTRMVLIAFVISVPLSWYLMSQWLEKFAYRINLSPATFLLAGAVTLFIAWITVSFQTIKAAIINPVRSLKSE